MGQAKILGYTPDNIIIVVVVVTFAAAAVVIKLGDAIQTYGISEIVLALLYISNEPS